MTMRGDLMQTSPLTFLPGLSPGNRSVLSAPDVSLGWYEDKDASSPEMSLLASKKMCLLRFSLLCLVRLLPYQHLHSNHSLPVEEAPSSESLTRLLNL